MATVEMTMTMDVDGTVCLYRASAGCLASAEETGNEWLMSDSALLVDELCDYAPKELTPGSSLRVRLTIEPVGGSLTWVEYEDDIYKDAPSYKSHQPWLEGHGRDNRACFTVVFCKSYGAWFATWRHGDRGYDIGRASSADDAKAICLSRFNAMIAGARR